MKTLKQTSKSKQHPKNISARKQIEKALRQGEKRYKQLLNSITDYIYSVEIKDGRPTKTVHGKGSEKVTGYTLAEYAADPKLWLSMVHPDDKSYVEHYADLIHEGKEVPPLEHRIIHKTGKICWIQNTYVLKHNADGKVIGYDGLISDITERKNTELELISANRIYAIISQINQIIARTKDKDRLFSEACRIAIEYGKFRMVWIGLVDERKQVVEPIAFDGFDDGFLATTKKISLRDIPEGYGPISIAIRKEKYHCCNDIANDSSIALWRDEALKRGYRSSISLPLIVYGKAIGAFNIFASESFFFNKSEIQLLKGVTGDIAYAIETIDTAEKRKQVEDALQRSEKKYRLLHESITDAVVSVDMTGRITECNKTYTKMLGYNNEELSKLSYLDITPPEWHSFESKIVEEQILKKGYSGIYEKEYIKKDGTVFPVELRTFLITDDRGVATNMWAIVRDITGRKSAEKALSESEEKYRILVETTGTGFVIVDDEGKVEDANQEYVRLTGYKTLWEIIGRKVTEWTAEYDIIRNAEEVKKCFEKGSVRNLQIDYIDTRGKIIPIEINANVLQTSSGKKIHTLCRDITQRKHAADALVEKEKIYRTLFDLSPSGIMLEDSQGNILDVNEALCRSFGYTGEELIGKNVRILVPSDRNTEIENHIAEILSGKTLEHVVINLKKDGSTCNMELHEILITLPTGKEGILVVANDITERKRIENALRDSEEKLRQVIDLVPHFVFAKNRKGQFILVNRAVAEAYGTTIESLIGKTDADFNRNQGEVEHFLRDDNDVMNSGQYKDIPEEIITDSTGHVRYLHTIKIPYYITATAEDAILGVSTDITERKVVESALKESEEQFRNLAEESPNMIFINHNGKIVYANNKCGEIMGYSREEFLSSSFDFRRLIAPASLGLIQDSLNIHLSGKEVPSFEYSLITKEGKYIQTIITTKLINYFGQSAILGIVTDITGRKRAEEQIKQSEERFRSLFQNSLDMITIHDENSILRYCTPSVEKILGYKSEELIGKNPIDFIYPDDSAMVVKELENVRQKISEGKATQYRFHHADGTWRWLETVANNQLDNPNIKGNILSSRDVTESKQAKEQLEKLNQQLRALAANIQRVREEESTRIAREIHDELGQILTGIKMDLAFLEDALLERSNTSQRDKLINKIESTSKLVDGAIKTVRKVTTELRPAILDSMGILAAIEWQAEEFQRRTGIACDYNSPLENIDLDRDRSTTIFRILQESLTNIVRHAKATKVRITFRKEDNALFFDVIDNGSGMLYQDVKKLNSFGILGMKERATLIGGHVEIHSIPGKGTTVSVIIPW